MIKVNNLKQIKTNIYEITFDNDQKIKVYDEVIIKFNLVVNSILDNNFVETIKKYNDVMIIFFKLRNSLIKKMCSKKTIIEKLNKENLDSLDEEEIIKKLEKLNLINDDNYLLAFVNSQINLTLNGPEKIKQNLLKENIDKEKINLELKKYDDSFWNDRINKIIDKRKKSNHKDSNKVFNIKTKEYIYSLGYRGNFDIENDSSNEFDILKKEYEKIIRKYERKGLDKRKLKYDLMKKGFNYEDIKKLEN